MDERLSITDDMLENRYLAYDLSDLVIEVCQIGSNPESVDWNDASRIFARGSNRYGDLDGRYYALEPSLTDIVASYVRANTHLFK